MEWISFWNPPVPSQNTMPARRVAQMRVVINAEEHIEHHVALGRRAKETAHTLPFLSGCGEWA